MYQERERRWFVLKIPRGDTNGGCPIEVTVNSERIQYKVWGKTISEKHAKELKWASVVIIIVIVITKLQLLCNVATQNLNAVIQLDRRGHGKHLSCCYALPLLRTNARILRLPFEL